MLFRSALATVMVTGFALLLAGGATVGGFFMKNLPPTTVMFIWDGVTCGMLFFALISVVAELQRSESIELTRLLHLPIGLKQVFVFNYLISLASLSTIIALALMGGLSLGFVAGRGVRFVLLGLLVPGFIFMLTAWVYCLRGWLLTLMVNPRRRRSVLMWLTLGLILISQSPQLVHLAVHKNSRRDRATRRAAGAPRATNVLAWMETYGVSEYSTATNAASAQSDQLERAAALVEEVNQVVPLLWLANGAHALTEGRMFPAVWGAAGMFTLGWLGLLRGYRSTLKFYRAEEKTKSASVPLA